VIDRRILLLGKKIRSAYVGKIERGEKYITIAILLEISDALKVNMGELIDF